MNIEAILFKDSDCNNCKLEQDELFNNPPMCDIKICHAKHESSIELIKHYNINSFPTIILTDLDANKEAYRFVGFVDSETIDNKIKEYESKHLV
jgi:hypothetical protein|nr:MAG TPA: Thioredoxin-like domain [Crassvirales sp.]